jgi:hypothetical protein
VAQIGMLNSLDKGQGESLCHWSFGSINKEPFLHTSLLTQCLALQIILGNVQRALSRCSSSGLQSLCGRSSWALIRLAKAAARPDFFGGQESSERESYGRP